MDSKEAFEVLLLRLNKALETTRGSLIEATQKGHFSDAQIQAGRGEEIVKSIEQLKALQSRWTMLCGEPSETLPENTTTRQRQRAQNGTVTSKTAYRMPILQALRDCGGSSSVKDLLDQVGKIMEPRLKPADFEVLVSVNEPRWRNNAKWERNQMVNEGLLKSTSPTGTWEISDAGREYLRQHKS
jgi:hypothetical protein